MIYLNKKEIEIFYNMIDMIIQLQEKYLLRYF